MHIPLSSNAEQERLEEDHRPIVSELQRELRTAMLEIEKLAKTSRDLARVNQELDESRLLAISDQIRTAKRLTLVSSQLEYTEQQLFDLTKDRDDGQKDADLLRIERIKREALQEREDASRLKIEALQDELKEVQGSERLLQQKLLLIQNKYETLAKRHDNVKRHQQELELARESKEALAWLKETTDRLCSPPKGSLGQAIQQERSSHSSAAISLPQSSPSSSPPYPSSFIDPPLAAQNQLISLIKELATTNSTLRSELNEYRDLLQDTRNEVLTLRSQVEDYEQGHAFECCGGRIDDGDSFRTSKSAWSTLDVSITGGGLDAASHIGTLGSVPGSPPPYMTTPTRSRLHHHFHHTGIRGSVFGELDRIYSQGSQGGQTPVSKKDKSRSSKRKSSREHRRGHHPNGSPSDLENTAATTVSASTSTSDIRRGSTPILTSPRSPLNPMPSRLRDQHNPEGSSPTSNASRSRRSMYTDADMDMLESGSESGDDHDDRNEDENVEDEHTSEEDLEGEEEPGFVAAFAEADIPLPLSSAESASFTSLARNSLTLLPAANLDDAVIVNEGNEPQSTLDSKIRELSDNKNSGHLLRANSISLLSAELQKATRSEPKTDIFMHGDAIQLDEDVIGPLEGRHTGSSSEQRLDTTATASGQDPSSSTTVWAKGRNNRLSQHEESSDQALAALRQRRRLSEPLQHHPSFNSLPVKKTRPGSIYSLRKTRTRMDSPELHCHHSGHMVSASAGCLPELQRYKSAELVEQMMTERRQRMMEAWREGVVAAAVAQRQVIHAVVASDPKTDADNMSIRSKASRRHVKASINDIQDEDMDLAEESTKNDSVTPATITNLPSHDSESTIRPDDDANDEIGLGIMAPTSTEDKTTKGSDNQDASPLSVNTQERKSFEAGSSSQNPSTTKKKNRRSVRSMISVRSSILRSPMVRSPHLARDRRFPSEASIASEAFSNRRHDYEQSPYQLLHTLSTDLLERLTRSDTRELNRRLQRTFDIQALSQMSNSVIENVLTDVSNLNERFRWVEAQVANPTDDRMEVPTTIVLSGGEGSAGSGLEDEDEAGPECEEAQEWGFSVEEFFPLANTVQEMLSEIGKLRMMINELQLSYVLKVEQDRIKAEKDFMQGSDDGHEDEYDTHDDLDFDRSQPQGKSSKGVLRMLDRPRILGSASTGVSGFFNKVFGGASNSASREPAREASEALKPGAATIESKDKPVISTAKSKSGVVAETSRIFADSAWISSPGVTAEPKTPKRQATVDGPRISSAGGIIVPGSRLSATTSLSTMATMSPARSSALHATEESSSTSMMSSVGARAIDIGTSPHSKTISRSPISASSLPYSATQRLYMQSSPRQGGDTQRVTFLHTQDIDPSSPPRAQNPSRSSSLLETAEIASATTAGSSTSMSTSMSTSTIPYRGRSPAEHRLPSFGLSTRVSGPALSVVTKGDVFHEGWLSSAGAATSSVSVNESIMQGIALSSATRPSEDSEATTETRTSTATTTSESQGVSSLTTSLSTSFAASEAVGSTVTSRLVSKPTIIARSALAMATPSTSTVSSPMSTTSWYDSRRSSGAPDAFPVGENGAHEGTLASGSGSGRGSGSSLSLATGAGNRQASESGEGRKTRTATSFHADAALEGSSHSATQSLGRASGRESALTFLRNESQSTSVLSSFLQTQPKQPQSPSRTTVRSPNSQVTRKSILKGKSLAWDSYGDGNISSNSKANLEILDGIKDDEDAEDAVAVAAGLDSERTTFLDDTGDATGYASRQDHNLIAYRSEATLLGSTSTSALMTVSTPTASLPQRAAVTSTAVAYVVATPDAHGGDERESGKKRAVFDRDLIKASQKRILASVAHHQENNNNRPFVPQSKPRRARAHSVDSAQSTEPLKQNEIMDLWRVGAGVSRDLWRGLIKKVDGRDS
ncbi:hypothetical protein BGX28_003658 [Mortierella sp. GBA30]|nr:hypothetical protein BGX28_003658 [Mortierella sp. GBA30]